MNLSSATLRSHPRGEAIQRIMRAALQAAEPGEAICRAVTRRGNALEINGKGYDLGEFERIHILGVGKAAPGMTAALTGLLADHTPRGLLIPKGAIANAPAGFDCVPGGHPLPNAASLQAGRAALSFVSGLTRRDLLFCLISGGGSALMSAPWPEISLQDLQTLTQLLLACGARVDEINTLRRHLDQLKGGGLAQAAAPAQVVSLILSDVVGNPLEGIASGPTAPDPTTRAEALAVLERYSLKKNAPQSILRTLQTAPETPKPGDPRFENTQNVIVASNMHAIQAALGQASAEGLHPYLICADLQGEARDAAEALANDLRWAWQTGQPAPRPACLLAGGETTVTLGRENGRGGRNTELALAAVLPLADFPNVVLVTLATDGEDGNAPAAGAVVSGDTWRRARQQGLDARDFLRRHDSFSFFEQLGDLIQPGPSGTNVNDLVFLFT